MPTSFTEGRHAAEFILSEANGARSRENGTAGEALTAGTVLESVTAGLVAYESGTIVGIALYGAASGEPVSYLARDAEVNLKLLTYPAESTAGGEEAATIAGLKTLNIITRD